MAVSETLFSSSLPELYERWLVTTLFRPFAQELLRGAAIRGGDRLLDVACGTGAVLRVALEQFPDAGARCVGIDASPAMLAVARTVAPEIDWRQGDAASLPLRSNETFDVVTCHQGLQFFPDKAGAVRDMRRALAPSGRVAIGTWRSVAETPLIRDLQEIAERHVGAITDVRHGFWDGNALTALLTAAGFRNVQNKVVTHAVRMPDGPAVFPRLNAMAIVGMSAAAKAGLTDDQRTQAIAAITNDSADVASRYLDGSDFVFELSSNIATGEA
jgi:SAM-dependent methyltransferase